MKFFAERFSTFDIIAMLSIAIFNGVVSFFIPHTVIALILYVVYCCASGFGVGYIAQAISSHIGGKK